MTRNSQRFITGAVTVGLCLLVPGAAWAAEGNGIFQEGRLDLRALLHAGGIIGYLIIALSVAMVALIIEHLLSIRRETLMPRAAAEELHKLMASGKGAEAEQLCKSRPCYLMDVMGAGLQERAFGYESVEKAMEDSAVEHSARLLRKIEWLSVIGAIAPMLGLMGTVWGMIQAFAEFAAKANPTPADFAPAISEALVTTLFGLIVAIPAHGAFAWFRNRIDELGAEVALLAEQLMLPLRRAQRKRTEPG